ncbi:MAG: efflux RND transporter periplasmic adaptor subunit [Sphingobacterium sp.]|jgi:membrane fusion protein (multidrug efflux system)|nr:efflux RND transporter periplasmic adaptor subunit [Sphingobacterium sp.]
MRTANSRWNSLIYVVGMTLFFSSCGQQGEEQANEMPPPETDFISLKVGNTDIEESYPGAIEGIINVDVKPQVSGYLSAVLVKEGEYVNKGQTLFRINPEVYNEQVNSGHANLKSALAAQKNAELEIEKLKPLVEGKVVTEIQMKSAKANYIAATAQVEQATAALSSSKINADFTVIKAPVSGYIGRIPNRIGTLVSPNDAIALTTLSDISTIQVYFSLTEADYLSFKKDGVFAQNADAVELILADGSAYTEKGKLETASGNINKTTGSISMKATFKNPERLLRSGGAAKIVLKRKLDNTIQIPIVSVKDLQDKFFVYKLSDSSKVSMVPIEIEGGTKDVYFVKSGVQQGDKIAINRIDMLQDGMIVTPKNVTVVAYKQ